MASNGYIVCAANCDPSTHHDTGVSDETEAENLIVNYASSPEFPLANAINLTAIGALGHSRGAESVIEQAATDNRIKVILGMEAANSTNAINNSSYVAVPAMLLFGSEDSNLLLNDNVNYYNNFEGSKEYIQINGAGHDMGIWNGTSYGFRFNLTTTPTTEKYVLSWFNYYLYSNSTASNVFNEPALEDEIELGIIARYAIQLSEPSLALTVTSGPSFSIVNSWILFPALLLVLRRHSIFRILVRLTLPLSPFSFQTLQIPKNKTYSQIPI